MKFGVGQAVRRREDDRLLRGKGRFLDDISLPSQAHAVVLRSPVSHGRIVALDAGTARGMPGVLAVWTHAETEGRLAPIVPEIGAEPLRVRVTQPHLADGKVLFAGQPVAFVVAATRAQALDAAEAVELDIDEEDPITDPEAALEDGAPRLHSQAPGNLAYRWETGDRAAVEAGFAAAARVVATRVVNQRVIVAAMESRAIVIRHDPETGRWEGWVGCQGAHGMRAKIARALKVEPARVRIHVPDVGGAFGMKLMAHPEYGLCALAAQVLGRPVKWIGDRSESFLSDTQGRDMRAEVEGAFDAGGRCQAMRMRVISNLGAFVSTAGAGVHTTFSVPLLGGMYRVPVIHAETRGVFTNTTPTDAYRGAGRPEVIHATERLMDQAALDFGIDRAEFRRINLLTPDMAPYRSPGGLTFDSLDPHRVMDRALERADYAGFEGRAAAARARGRIAGIGVAYYMERTGGAPLERVRMELTPGGGLRIWVGTQDTGQGHETAWAQVAHEKLGLDLDRITVMAGDSDALPAGGGTGGSRSLIMASRVILRGSDDMIAQGRALAAERLEAAPADIAFSAAEGGVFRVAGTDLSVALTELAAAPGGIVAEGAVDDIHATFPNGCHVAEVEIDPETGGLALTRYTMADDFGTLINPELAAGQVYGGVAQGVGQVMGEAAAWDPATGQPLAASFMDYRMPRAADFPQLNLSFLEIPSLTNPLGVKGCGESGAVGGIAATALAVRDALRRAGAEEIETPFTPLRLWRALNGAQ
jgi:carbon-monoxide dehydrogenase large subunit